jgi:arylsulfatase A-like enzyme
VNVLFVTLDQIRGDALSCAGHPVVRTPHLDRLAAAGVRFARHHSQSAPCSPGRASLYTGTYQANHRVVANGTPLDDRFDNVARLARRAGYRPALFGYTDQALDPRLATGPDDPRLRTYEGVLPGFDAVLQLSEDMAPWRSWLQELGHDPGRTIDEALAREPDRPAEHSISAFLTDGLLAWIDRQDGPWFAHASYLRPHPPYAAAGHFARAVDPDEVDLPIAPVAPEHRHPAHATALAHPAAAAPSDEGAVRRLRAQYYGMVEEVDHQLGRLWDGLAARGLWDDTLVVVTADHGELLGDHGLVQKLGWFESSYHIPCIVRDPRLPSAHGSVVERFTENVDILPTIADAVGQPVPVQCDGLPLTAFLRGAAPPWWRDATHWEYDWRSLFIAPSGSGWPWDRRLERQNLAVTRTDVAAYVQFANRSWLAYDLAADPTWRTPLDDLGAVLALAQQQLLWRAEHAERTLTGTVLAAEPIGLAGLLPS